MRKNIWLASAVAAAVLSVPVAAHAATIFYSGDGDASELVTPGAVTPITPHSLWGTIADDSGAPAEWISYANTGVNGSVAVNSDCATQVFGSACADIDATAHFQREFTVGTAGTFTLWILADDTASAYVDGVALGPQATNSQGTVCNDNVPVSCTEAAKGIYSIVLAAGTYTLDVYAFQLNNDVFGVQYAGTFSDAVVPEPASMALLGTGLLGLAARARKRFGKNKKA